MAKQTAKTAKRKSPKGKPDATQSDAADRAEPEKQEAPPPGDAAFEVIASRHFASWMAGQGVSLAFTTYQASKLFLLGLTPEGELSVAERTIERCMGLVADRRSLYVASKWQIWRFENALRAGERADGFDAVYVPKASHVTGDVDCHEMAVDADGRLLFVNTLFNCLSYLSRDYSFHPVWRPEFVSGYVPEDRCHLNGLAMSDGRVAYVSAVSKSDVADGWRDRRADGGVIVDVYSGEVVCEGLSMPHSPRVHDRALWVQESGTGYLGRIDTDKRTFERVTLCPGYLRGMAIVGNFAVCGVSKAREGASFGGLELGGNLEARDTEPRCGLLVIDLSSGNILHWVRFEGVVEELFGVTALPGIQRPRAVGFKTDEIARTISLPPELL